MRYERCVQVACVEGSGEACNDGWTVVAKNQMKEERFEKDILDLKTFLKEEICEVRKNLA